MWHHSSGQIPQSPTRSLTTADARRIGGGKTTLLTVEIFHGLLASHYAVEGMGNFEAFFKAKYTDQSWAELTTRAKISRSLMLCSQKMWKTEIKDDYRLWNGAAYPNCILSRNRTEITTGIHLQSFNVSYLISLCFCPPIKLSAHACDVHMQAYDYRIASKNSCLIFVQGMWVLYGFHFVPCSLWQC